MKAMRFSLPLLAALAITFSLAVGDGAPSVCREAAMNRVRKRARLFFFLCCLAFVSLFTTANWPAPVNACNGDLSQQSF